MQYTLVKYSAQWCSSCKQLSKSIEQVDLASLDTTLKEVDIDTMDRLVMQNTNIKGVPMLVLMKDDKEVSRKTGYMPSEAIYKWLNNAVDSQ